jgi:hypothetical protein
LDREFVDQNADPTNYQRKTMSTDFFRVGGMAILAILPHGCNFTSRYFQEHILPAFTIKKYQTGRKPGLPCYMLQFDNAPAYVTERLKQTLNEYEFQRLEQAPYSRDLSHCHFYLLG